MVRHRKMWGSLTWIRAGRRNERAITRWCWDSNIVMFISWWPPNPDSFIIFQCQLWKDPLSKKVSPNLVRFHMLKEKEGGLSPNSHLHCKKKNVSYTNTVVIRYLGSVVQRHTPEDPGTKSRHETKGLSSPGERKVTCPQTEDTEEAS